MINNRLLFFVDEGGFEDFTPLFLELGYQVDLETNPRKAVKLAKGNNYTTLVVKFSYNPEFRDRVSNIESLLATAQGKSPQATIIILFDLINQPQLTQFLKRYPADYHFALPIKKEQLIQALKD